MNRSAENMSISVILCTYNRCQSLRRALESVAASRMPENAVWKIVVVDNNSSDATPSVVREFEAKHPGRFRYIFESKPGKSNALNRGIADTNAEVLAFMDDDVIVDPDWLWNLTKIFEDEKYVGSGGVILPETNFKQPKWLDTSYRYSLAPLAMFDLGPKSGELREPPFGTNMAFRREVFRRFGVFRCDLGPHPDSEIRGEDTEFGMRVLQGGGRLWYEPAAVVHHEIPQKRLKPAYFLKWWFDKGRSEVRENGSRHGTRWVVANVPLSLFRRVLVWTARWMLTFQSAPRFTARLRVWQHCGAMTEYRSLARSRIGADSPAAGVATGQQQ